MTPTAHGAWQKVDTFAQRNYPLFKLKALFACYPRLLKAVEQIGYKNVTEKRDEFIRVYNEMGVM